MADPVPVRVSAPTREPSGQTTAYILPGEKSLLVDPAARSEELEAAIRSHEVTHVAVTHHHPDHVGGVAPLAAEYDLTVWARAGRAEGFATATGVRADCLFSPGDVLDMAGGVTVLDTPGHAVEHVTFGVEDVLLTGDLVVAEGSVVVGGPGGDMRAYLTSLRRVHARNPATLLPAHGPSIDAVRPTCERLIAHRLRREDRVLAAVRAGAATPAAIVEAAYDKDVSAVADLARLTVIAHLEKLDVEGRVTWDGERAQVP